MVWVLECFEERKMRRGLPDSVVPLSVLLTVGVLMYVCISGHRQFRVDK